eukprot:gene1048-1217_t
MMTAGVDLNDIKRRMDGAINAFKNDIASLRTGRASANVLDPVVVEAYGSRVPLNQVANVTVPEPRMLGVSIWDKSMVNAVDRAIREANLGLNPIVDGTTLRLPIPDQTEERRKELAKLAVVVGMALVVAERADARWRTRVGTVDVLAMLGVAAVPATLIMLQPDLGTMLVLSAT